MKFMHMKSLSVVSYNVAKQAIVTLQRTDCECEECRANKEYFD